MGQDDEMVDFDAGEERVFEWEDGLPRLEDLTPLSQMLIPPELASAFSISFETCRNMEDVDRASRDTISKLRMGNGIGSITNNSKALPPLANRALVPEGGDNDDRLCSHTDDNEGRRGRESEFSLLQENSTDDPSSRMLKRPRLVWTPQLHKRFVDVVGHLGIKNAVPKTIMQMMNVEGLTRENVASHLQKYRLYLKRIQGFPGEGRSSLDQLFASTPVPQSLTGAPFVSVGHRKDSTGHMPIPMPYVAPFVPMPVVGTAQSHHGALAIHGPAASNMFEAQSSNGFDRNLIPQKMSSGDHHRDWPCNKF